jgi:4-amino-4-deoxy-L-arabinose transferase-like glycosyltransferase
MAFEQIVQSVVHKLEEGSWVPWVKLAVLTGAVAFVSYLWFFGNAGFRGLNHEKAMEQAQISREIARGNGFSTKEIRPAALWLFEKNKGAFPVDRQPDIYHAPLYPWVNSWPLRLVRSSWPMTSKDIQYTPDKIIAAVGIIFFLLSVVVNYFTARRLFDHKLAIFGVGIMLLCQKCWDFALAGLPQMAMLFLFSCAIYTLLRAVENQSENRPTVGWLAATGLLFGLLALTHGLTMWIFGGLFLVSLIFFRPVGRGAFVMLAVFVLCYSPWLVRNYMVCGTPVGLGWYSGLAGIRGTESSIMRSMEVKVDDVTPRLFRRKVQTQTIEQFANIYGYLGSVVVAPVFFVALLHIFKRRETGVFRWFTLVMWMSAVVGMSVFGLMEESGLKANDLHILFVPLMSFYGMALILVMWSRIQLNIRFAQVAFLTIVFAVSGLPFINQFLELVGPPASRIQWPPYIPPFIAIMNGWTEEKEIITSDMPWAVAWYADRKSLWLPMSVKDFLEMNDYGQLNGQIVGMYLTPVSGNRPFLSDIAKGEFREWGQFIMRTPQLRDFPLKYSTALPVDNECVFYSDRDRWTNRED